MSEEKFTATAKVIWFNPKKGYGFLKCDDGKDLFVHWKNIEDDGFKTLRENQTVSYELGENDVGEQAIKVVVMDE